MNFAAIDFETATSARNSACSVAVVEVCDGKLFDSCYTLIRPPENRCNYFNTRIHGITRADTATAPDFAAIWPELAAHLAGRIVAAHNARFDMGVLRACLQDAELRAPGFAYADTVTIARRVWPELPNHKLDTVGNFLHIDFQHHNALDDARTCAAIPLYAGRAISSEDFRDLAVRLGVRIYPFGSRHSTIPRG